ncbi:response regulator [Rhodocytophaga rosea]|uniref:Sensory/regulatory protein RpfC n=1 Tax=Rhodocytophaga rosea TaxID=2704465 RepID=A0A6C0GD37_9BACT|nr:ATP-binding protein [Rhodocytophaga rosea]QHT65817.1 response regulator [Rhodocytophaga rosea]
MKQFLTNTHGFVVGCLCFIWLFLFPFLLLAKEHIQTVLPSPEQDGCCLISLSSAFVPVIQVFAHFPAQVPVFSSINSLTEHIQVLFYGFIIAMILYQLLLYFYMQNKKRLHLYSTIYIAASGLFTWIYTGPFSTFQVSGSVSFAYQFGAVFTAIWLASAAFLLRSLFTSNEDKSFFTQVIEKMPIAALVLAALTFLPSPLGGIAGIVLSSFFGFASLGTLYRQHQAGNFAGRYLFIVWPFLLVCKLALQVITLGWLIPHESVIYGIMLTSMASIVLLPLLEARNLNQMQSAQELVQKEILQAEQSRRFKDQFLANTSHEIRTPMNAIVGFTRLLEQSVLATTQREYVRYIKDSANNLLVIINDILDFSKIESGKITFERVNIHLDQLCRSVIETLRFRMEEKKLQVSYHIDKKIPELFLGDPVRLNQILLNLFSNAIKFTEEGSVHLKAQLLHQTETQIQVLFEVTDTGIGIAEDKLHLIFESFSQANDHTTRRYGGTGLGLTIVKQLVELQGGTIQVKSRLHEGSTFSVIMPFDKGMYNTHVQARNYTAAGAIPENLTILLLEDNPINQVLAVNTLQKWLPTIQIDIGNNGKEGIEKLAIKDYHLLLVDIQMPEMDGFATTQYIRSTMPAPKNAIPIIALTAGALKSDEEQALAAGMDDFISKPFDAEVLFTKIRRLLAGKDVPVPAEQQQISPRNKFEISHVQKAGLNDPEFMVQLMNMFLEKTPEALQQMESSAQSQNWKQVGFIAHRIKSVFVCMGLSHLQHELWQIEQAAVNEVHTEYIPDKIKQLHDGCKEAFVQITQERNKLVNNLS